MDSFINLAKQGYATYQESQSNVSKTGSAEYNSPHHSGQDDLRKGGYGPNIDHDAAIHAAKQHGSGDADIFSTALSFLGANKEKHTDPVDEEEVINAHKKVYEKGDTSGLSAHSIGSAAALQVLKQFTSGSSSNKGGNSQTQMISMAMAEATKMFDKTGGGGKGNKQEAVNGAAMTIMKLLVQSKGGSPFGGGSNSGGLGGLLSLASKFA